MTRVELKRFDTWYEARVWAIENQCSPSTPDNPTQYQIRKHPGYYAVVERVAAKK